MLFKPKYYRDLIINKLRILDFDYVHLKGFLSQPENQSKLQPTLDSIKLLTARDLASKETISFLLKYIQIADTINKQLKTAEPVTASKLHALQKSISNSQIEPMKIEFTKENTKERFSARFKK